MAKTQINNNKESKMSETININGVEYVPASEVRLQTSGDVRIVVLQRGWVVVGRYSQDGAQVTLENASVIRNWGTTQGLGEIALGGPTSKTVLDKCPTVRAHELAVVMTVDCVSDTWAAYV